MNRETCKNNEDAALMAEFRNGDKKAFDRLIGIHQDSLTGFLYKFTLDRAAAEDLAQDVFLKIYISRDRYGERSSFQAWMYRIAYNRAVDYLRKKKRRKTFSLETSGVENMPMEETRGGRNPEAERNLDEAARALDSLPARQRAAFTLAVLEGRSYSETANILRVSKSAVESLVFRARRGIKESIEKQSGKKKDETNAPREMRRLGAEVTRSKCIGRARAAHWKEQEAV